MQETQKLERVEAGGSCLIDSISQRITVRSAIRISRFFLETRALFVLCTRMHVYGVHELLTYDSIIF